MDETYGIHSTDYDYAGKTFMYPDNPMIPADYNPFHYQSVIFSGDHHHHHRSTQVLESEFQCSVVSESASINVQNQDEEEDSSVIKAKIASHPSYPKLLEAYIDCQKVGAPPEMSRLLDEIRREKEIMCQQDAVSTSLGVDPELDEFMETYCEVLVRYKADLSRPFDEATSFLNNIETQLGNLCIDDGGLSSDEEVSGWEAELQDPEMKIEEGELKDRLLRRYGGHISSLKLEFSKKKKKVKLPKEARQTLLQWWNAHYTWPYPTEVDKISLAESTGLDPKQINNWFINQRKRHWKPSENMQLALMDNLSGHFFMDD